MKGAIVWLLTVGSLVLSSPATAQERFSGIGRTATPAEVAAWDIDVRPDFKGLPKGAGSVKKGQQVWEAKCESCHGTFGESNEVFTPIAGGITKKDIETGYVASLMRPDFPQRTTLMKLSEVSTLWDYINRAMPWNAPKSLSVEEVYAVTAYVLSLGDIVTTDFVLSNDNIAEVQKRLPNRNGKIKWSPLWDVRGKGDVTNVACMSNCKQEMKKISTLPDHVRDAHGNLAEQSRLIGATRGVDTTKPVATIALAGRVVTLAAAASPVVAKADASREVTNTTNAANLAKKYTCTTCHAVASKLVGPSHAEIAKKYAGNVAAVANLMNKIKQGGSGVWGAVPMPPHAAIPEAELRQLAEWSLRGGR